MTMSELLKAVENCKRSKGWDEIPFNLHSNIDLLFVECKAINESVDELIKLLKYKRVSEEFVINSLERLLKGKGS